MNALYQFQELAAIWLTKTLITGQGPTRRLAPGATVQVEGEEIVDCVNPTHKVIGTYGSMYDQFEVTLMNIETNELTQIKL